MDFVCGLQKAIDYIEENITEELDYNEIAKRAGFSSFYFQRIFGILCNCSLGEYIRNRRLTLAGAELYSSNVRVIDIALKYGYESPESFTRAFVKFHGITPSDAKKSTQNLKSFSRLSVEIILKGGSVMNYKIVKKDAFKVIEKISVQSMDDSVNKNTIPAFWEECHKKGTVAKLLSITPNKEFIFGICYGGELTLKKPLSTVLRQYMMKKQRFPRALELMKFLLALGRCLNVSVPCPMQCRIPGIKSARNFSLFPAMSLHTKWILKHIPQDICRLIIIKAKSGCR